VDCQRLHAVAFRIGSGREFPTVPSRESHPSPAIRLRSLRPRGNVQLASDMAQYEDRLLAPELAAGISRVKGAKSAAIASSFFRPNFPPGAFILPEPQRIRWPLVGDLRRSVAGSDRHRDDGRISPKVAFALRASGHSYKARIPLFWRLAPSSHGRVRREPLKLRMS
jgi:hypothetical protein